MIITGHRGSLGSEPENTLRSFRRAVADGCDEIELDLRVTADDELVVLHDATVDRTTNGSGPVEELTFDELRQLDAGQGEQVPTWAETVEAVDVRLQAEVKAARAVPLLVASLQADPALAARTMVTSSHAEILLAVRRALPDASTGLIFGRTPDVADVLALTRAAEAGTALCGSAGLTVDGVAELHRAGLDVTAWPVPDAATFARAVELGVDAITTDHPERLRSVVSS
ncbi:glycerophosphoryl diester phosphodiesterase [Kribbella flavida DSM 17836]|uniref:Glycerophosphoryl diester phosphodiesterase n=1 Tax=Kribbella flavida (strain DSM 17836 / JCM 10339 / NBRC 14399) TaxID=479435 RepID=D2PZR9_KRIFD|nr:glycerophosphodiester phosphodiesterase family protein [Kribbella flavida]ADB35635.1 glycerophosphoryl diester phosphodiesterase [Kribbella flavida DSM 17836]